MGSVSYSKSDSALNFIGLNPAHLSIRMIRINEDRSLYGEGHGTITTNDGEIVTWKGQGVGKMKGKGIESRGSPFYNTSSKKLSRLNNLVGVYEHHMDELGNFETEIWEWS